MQTPKEIKQTEQQIKDQANLDEINKELIKFGNDHEDMMWQGMNQGFFDNQDWGWLVDLR